MGCTIFIIHLVIVILQKIKEEGDDSCIDQISEHGTNDGDDEERLDGIAVFITYSTHVGHSIGGCTNAGCLYHIQFNTCHTHLLVIVRIYTAT